MLQEQVKRSKWLTNWFITELLKQLEIYKPRIEVVPDPPGQLLFNERKYLTHIYCALFNTLEGEHVFAFAKHLQRENLFYLQAC